MDPQDMMAIIYSLVSGEAKVVGTNCPIAARLLREFIAENHLDATVKLIEDSLPPDMAFVPPCPN